MPERLLAIYLNDHLAGAAAGVGLARRAAGFNRGDDRFGPPLERLRVEIEEDRATLALVMARLGVERSRVKPALARAAERLGRLKPNGQLRGYSPLGRLIDLEGLYVGISGKARLWRVLEASVSGRVPEIDFAALGERADRQRAEVERLQDAAAEAALG